MDVSLQGRAYEIQASADTGADIETAWRTLTDYERLPQFVPNISSVRVLRRSRVDGLERLLIEQRGEFRFLFFVRPVTVRMDVVHNAPTRVDARAVATPGSDETHVEFFEGRYDLQRTATGVRVHYVARIIPRFALPPLIGTLAVRQTARAEFEAMLAEIERRNRTPATRTNLRQ